MSDMLKAGDVGDVTDSMPSKEKKAPNTPKLQLLNKPANCPWTSRAPLATNSRLRNTNFTESDDPSLNRHSPSISVNSNNININTFLFHKRNFPGETSQESSAQFFHFLRLMQLFPDVHPATLHTVMSLCRNDFFMAVDKLLYAKRCKDLCARRKSLCAATCNNSKYRHQPYSQISMTNGCVRIGIGEGGSQREQPKLAVNQKQQANRRGVGADCDMSFPSRSMDSTRHVYGNKSKSREIQNCTDLPPVASPKCSLPIQPLSPTCSSPQDLSISQNEDLQLK